MVVSLTINHNNIIYLCCILIADYGVAQLADCYSGGDCRNDRTFGTIEQCCNSSNTSRSFQRQGGEICELCQCKHCSNARFKQLMNCDHAEMNNY